MQSTCSARSSRRSMRDVSISSTGTSKFTLSRESPRARERERERETVRAAHRAVLNLYVIKKHVKKHKTLERVSFQTIAEALYLDMSRAKVSRSQIEHCCSASLGNASFSLDCFILTAFFQVKMPSKFYFFLFVPPLALSTFFIFPLFLSGVSVSEDSLVSSL